MEPKLQQPSGIKVEIFILAIFNIVLHLVFNHNLEYHRDELLYFSLGQHPDFGFATVPPMIGWIAWLMKSVFGYSLFAVRIFPALISGVMVFIVADLARELGGKRFAMTLAATGLIISIFGLRTFILFQPVHLDLFFWTLTFYIIVKYIKSESDRYLLMFGMVAGFSLLAKYLIGLLFLLILLIIPFTAYRNVFRKKMFWFGIAAGFIIFLPNLIWQIVNGLPVIHHLSELAATQLVNVDRSAFLMEQIIIPGAASFLTVAGLIFLLLNRQMKDFRFLGIIAVLVVLSLMLMKGKSYYTIGIFPFLISAGAVSYESVLKRWYSRIIFIVLLVFMTYLALPYGLPVYNAKGLIKYFDRIESMYGFDFGRNFEDGSKHSLPQDYADMLGWEELTAITDSAWKLIPDKTAAFIYCDNYGQAGAINVIGKKYGLPEPVCFSESFRYWIPGKFDPDIKTFIYINDELGDDVRQLFRNISIIGSIRNKDAREYGTTVYLCEDPETSFNVFWTARLKMLEDY